VSDTLLIDADVHEGLLSRNQLLPYLAPIWQRVVTDYTPSPPNIPYAFPYGVPSPGKLARLEWIEPGVAPGSTLDQLQRQLLDGEGVSVAILNGNFHPSALQGSYEFAAALAAAYNDWQIEEWLEKEPRLRGSVHVVAHDPQLAAREIDRVGAHPQIVQVFLPLVHDRQYGDPMYRPIFEAAVRHDLVVTMHHGGHTETVLGYPRTFIEWHTLAAPHAGQAQLLSLICNGVFDRFPTLKVALLETGVAWLPWFMWRLDQQYREVRVEVPWVKRLPSEHIRESVRIATQPLADVKPQQFARLIEETESQDVFVFATDWPHYDADSVDAVLPKTLPEELGRRIRYENAVATYPRLGVTV
jgi:predicted TIM-barrel fold metal-dependent hydrolase